MGNLIDDRPYVGNWSTDILNKLRQKHALEDGSGMWYGVDMLSEDIANNLELFVWVRSVVNQLIINISF